MALNSNFWKNKKVLLTGHTGFKGGWLSIWLKHLGANVTGVALPPASKPNLFEKANVIDDINSIYADIRNLDRLKSILAAEQPEVVFHLAAQPLVRASYNEPVYTYETNVIGSINVLESIRHCDSVRAVVMVTTDKCYENKEQTLGYKETDTLGGYDPYSSSKACTELLTASFRSSFFSDENSMGHQTAIATARAGNVIGGGDWAQDRLIPDIIRAAKSNNNISLRSPKAVRPWQHVLEPLAGYLLLAERLFSDGAAFAQAWNFGPEEKSHKTVDWIATTIAKKLGSQIDIDPAAHPHETKELHLDCSKAEIELGWKQKWPIEIALNKTIEWHERESNGQHDMHQITLEQIKHYSSDTPY